MRLLIAEDNADAARIFKLLLEPYGDVDTVSDGDEALAAVREGWTEEDPYDVMLLDIMMPRMDGLETLKRLRAEEEKRGLGGVLGIKVVMLTALEEDSTVLEALRLGCEGYVFKSGGKQKILAKLKELGVIS